MQPQRPLRTLRVHGDENIPPVTNASKTLHSRNKSSPALSTMAAIGALKGAVKRTAFGDVSNTANIHRPSRDDSVINGKSGYEMNEKIVHIQRDKKPTTFLRPAQRPVSEAITKGSVNHTGITLVSATAKAIVAETQQSLQIANTRKVIKKKSTPIFRDAASSKLVQDSIEVQGAPGPTKAPVPHGPSDPHLKENPRLPEVAAEPQNQTRKTKSKPIPPPEVIKEGTAPSAPTTVEIRDPYSEEAPYFNNNGAIQLGEYSDYIQENCHVEPLSNGFVDAHTALQEVVGEQSKNRYDPSIETQPTAQQDVGYKHKLLPVSEPEEYWDDDEEEDNYDEEGYVTAPSKSLRGDNTTGGATTILFPKVNNKTKREIAAAKEVVEASRTAEEIEDEAWDMSMVAEYGDEIFAYMKELEVLFTILPFSETIADSIHRSKCSQTPTTWTTRPRSNGRCAPSSWTGSSKYTTASVSSPKRSSSASTTSTAFFPARSSLLASFNLSVPPPSLLLPSTRRSTVHLSRKSSTW